MANKKKKKGIGLTGVQIVNEKKPKTISSGSGIASGLRSASAEKSSSYESKGGIGASSVGTVKESATQRAERERSNKMRNSALFSIAKTMSKNSASTYKATLPSIASRAVTRSKAQAPKTSVSSSIASRATSSAKAQAPKTKVSSSMLSRAKEQTKVQAPKSRVVNTIAKNALAPVSKYAESHMVTGGHGVGTYGFKTSVRQKALAPAKEIAEYTRKQQNKYVYTPNNDYRFDANGNMLTKKDPISIEYGKKLRAGMPSKSTAIMSWRGNPSKEELKYRDKYGYTQKAREALDTRLNENMLEATYSPTTGEITPSKHGRALLAGHSDTWSLGNIEDTYRKQYGIDLDKETLDKIKAQRETANYTTGSMIAQAEQYAATRGLLGAFGLVGKAADAISDSNKVVRFLTNKGVKTGTAKAITALMEEMGIDQAASVPLNLVDAMKADGGANIIKRFGINQGLDVLFSGLSEIPALKRNWHFLNGNEMNEAANAMQEGTEKLSTKIGAKGHLDTAMDETGDVARQEAEYISREEKMRKFVQDVQDEAKATRTPNIEQYKNAERIVIDGDITTREAFDAAVAHGVPESDRYEWQIAFNEARRVGTSVDDSINYADIALEENAVRQFREQTPSERLALARDESNGLASARDDVSDRLNSAAAQRGDDVLLNAKRNAQQDNGLVGANDRLPAEERGTYGKDVTRKYTESIDADNGVDEAIAAYDRPLTELTQEEDELWDATYKQARLEYATYPDADERAVRAADAAVMQKREIDLANAVNRADEASRELRKFRNQQGQEPKAKKTPNVEQKPKVEPRPNNESVYDATYRLFKNWGNDDASHNSYRVLVDGYRNMSPNELVKERNALRRAVENSSIDPAEAADRTAVIDAIAREKEKLNVTGRKSSNAEPKASKQKAKAESKQKGKAKTAKKAEEPKAETASKEEVFVSEEQVDKVFNDAIRKRSYRFETLRAYPRSGDMRIIYMDDAYDENGFRRLIREDIEKANAQKVETPRAKATEINQEPKAEPNANRSKEAWDEIENIVERNDEPKDLMREKPNRKENTIPKASDQKVKKEVFNQGESLGKSNAKDTAEKATQEAPKKRNQVKGVLNGEKPNTKYSDMSTAELQAQRHRFEEQTKHDLNAGKSEDEIFKIDEEFARRGEKPKWFEVEPEQGGTKVRSPIEAKRENERLAEKYGKFDNGSTKKVETEDGVKRNSKSVDTMLGYVSPEAEHVVANNMLNGDYARDGKTVEEFVSEVSEKLSDNPHAYMEQLSNFDSKMDARERLVGVEVAQEYAKNTGDVEYETKMIEAYQKIVPEAASVLKIHGILKKASKPARRDLIEKEIAQFEKRFEKRLKRAGIDHLTLKKETREAIINATTREETSKAWAKASIEIWNQIPASLKEKADFIRINAMLFNPKTHIRNVLGNAIFAPMREMKNITGTGLEFIAEKAGIIDKASRTKAIIPDKDGVKYADTVLKEEGDDIRGLSRYMEDLAEGRPFDPKAKLFMAGRENGNPVLNGFRKFADGLGDINSWALEYEDFVFFNKAFKTQYGRTMKARGLTVQDLIDNPKLRNEVTEVATEEALRATYRDESAAARLISRWKNPPKNARVMRKAGGLALDAILPFTKTPINILRRAVDYSPAGAGKGIYHLARGMHDHNQKMIVRGLDQLASAIPGSGLAMLGWFMAENDHVTSKLGSDKDDQFMKDLGKQNFSIVFNAGKDNEWSYTVDWAAPGCIPFFTGVAFKEMSDEGVDFWETADAFEQMFEPMTEMSVMQGVKNTLETFQRESGGGVWQGVVSTGINTGLQYAGQFKPTLSGQIARTIDPVRRDTTSTAESATKRQVERWVNKQKASIPGLSKTLNPYQNVWGDEENNTYNEDLPMRIIENFFSPGYAKKYKADDVDKEIISLYEQDPSNDKVIPSKLNKYEIGFDGGTVRLSEEDRSNYIKTQGKVSKDILKSIIKTGEYKDLSLADKQKTFTKAYSDAGAEAKRDTLLKMGKDEWKVYTDDFSGSKKDYKAAKEAGLSAKTYFDIMTKGDEEADRSGNGSLYKSEVVMYLNSREDLTDEQREILFSKMSTAKNPYTDGTAHTTDWEAEYQSKLKQSEKTENTNLSKAFAGATPREEGSMAAKLFNKSVIERAKEAAENGGSSKGSSRRGRSGRRGGGGSGSSKRKQTASERKFANGTGKLSSVDLEKIYKQTQGKQTKLPTVDLIKIYEKAKIKPAKVPTTSLVKAYTQVQQASKTKTPTPMDIKVKGLTKSQKKAMLKVMLKKLDTKR